MPSLTPPSPPKFIEPGLARFLDPPLDMLGPAPCAGLVPTYTQSPEPAIRMADIRDVTDGIGKLRKSYNQIKQLHLLKSSRWFDIKQ